MSILSSSNRGEVSEFLSDAIGNILFRKYTWMGRPKLQQAARISSPQSSTKTNRLFSALYRKNLNQFLCDVLIRRISSIVTARENAGIHQVTTTSEVIANLT